MKVVVTFDCIPEGMLADEVKATVQMAVAEYWSRRVPCDVYVSKRYQHQSVAWRAAKLPRVERACALMGGAHVDVIETYTNLDDVRDSIEQG